MTKPAKNTICLWYNGDAEDAARFYAKTFPDSSVGAVHRAPGDFPSGRKGDVLTVEFTVMGIPCLGLNGGPAFKHNEHNGARAARAKRRKLCKSCIGSMGHSDVVFMNYNRPTIEHGFRSHVRASFANRPLSSCFRMSLYWSVQFRKVRQASRGPPRSAKAR
jgi:hypothetical protein